MTERLHFHFFQVLRNGLNSGKGVASPDLLGIGVLTCSCGWVSPLLTQPSCRPLIVSSHSSKNYGPCLWWMGFCSPWASCLLPVCWVSRHGLLLYSANSFPFLSQMCLRWSWASLGRSPIRLSNEFTYACLSSPNISFQYVPPVGQDMLRLPMDLADAHCFTDPPPVPCCPSFQVWLCRWNCTPSQLLRMGLFSHPHLSRTLAPIPGPCMPSCLDHRLQWTEQGLHKAALSGSFSPAALCWNILTWFVKYTTLGRETGNQWVARCDVTVISHMQWTPAWLSPVVDPKASVIRGD